MLTVLLFVYFLLPAFIFCMAELRSKYLNGCSYMLAFTVTTFLFFTWPVYIIFSILSREQDKKERT